MQIIQIDPDVEYATKGFSADECEHLGRAMERRGRRIMKRQTSFGDEPDLPPKIRRALDYLSGVAYWQTHFEMQGKRVGK